MISLGRDLGAFIVVLYRLAERRLPGVYASGLDRQFAYTRGLFFTVPQTVCLGELVLTHGLAVMFFAYAYWQLFTSGGPTPAVVWVSLALTTVLLGAAAGVTAVVRHVDPIVFARDTTVMRRFFER